MKGRQGRSIGSLIYFYIKRDLPLLLLSGASLPSSSSGSRRRQRRVFLSVWVAKSSTNVPEAEKYPLFTQKWKHVNLWRFIMAAAAQNSEGKSSPCGRLFCSLFFQRLNSVGVVPQRWPNMGQASVFFFSTFQNCWTIHRFLEKGELFEN